MNKPYHKTDFGNLYNGNCLDVLKQMADESVDCCVTSPPYWGLRDYGTAEWVGGDVECDHKVGRFEYAVNEMQAGNIGSAGHQAKDICPKCGAVRKDKQLGLEKTPEEYVANMLQLFRDVRRVLKRDGTLWLNLGDSYNGSGGAGGDYNAGGIKEGQPKYNGRNTGSLKPKDLVGIPWRVAFALQQPYEYHTIKAERDRAYIAGLVDGEGCITILKTKSSHCDSQSYPPIVQVRMCDIEAIDYFAMLLGVKRSEAELYNSQKSANQRPAYSVKAT